MVMRKKGGHRHSVLAVARCPGALIVGAMFVLGAAFARHWDKAITLGNLISPYLISLATALLVFSIVRGTVRLGEAPMSSFPSFLGVYWMTAPLAWLYAIPVETFLSEYDATVVNLLLLLAVAAWRVALMVRATAVVLGGADSARLGHCPTRKRNHLAARVLVVVRQAHRHHGGTAIHRPRFHGCRCQDRRCPVRLVGPNVSGPFRVLVRSGRSAKALEIFWLRGGQPADFRTPLAVRLCQRGGMVDVQQCDDHSVMGRFRPSARECRPSSVAAALAGLCSRDGASIRRQDCRGPGVRAT